VTSGSPMIAAFRGHFTGPAATSSFETQDDHTKADQRDSRSFHLPRRNLIV
jgi:hypothetical protein